MLSISSWLKEASHLSVNAELTATEVTPGHGHLMSLAFMDPRRWLSRFSARSAGNGATAWMLLPLHTIIYSAYTLGYVIMWLYLPAYGDGAQSNSNTLSIGTTVPKKRQSLSTSARTLLCFHLSMLGACDFGSHMLISLWSVVGRFLAVRSQRTVQAS